MLDHTLQNTDAPLIRPAGSRPARLPRRASWPLWTVAVLGTALSCLVFFLARGLEEARLQAQFDKLANARTQALQRTIDGNLEVLRLLGAFVQGSQRVERHEFRTFVGDALARHPELYALQWRPRIEHGERAAFEQSVRAEGSPDFSIVDATADGAFVRAADRQDYYPILYAEPLALNTAVLGLDAGDSPERRDAMAEAKSARGPVVSSRIELYEPLPEGENAHALLVYLPVRSVADSGEPLGLAVAVEPARAVGGEPVEPYTSTGRLYFVQTP